MNLLSNNFTSSLVIDSSIENLRAAAAEFARTFNPADVFWLTNQQEKIQVKETLEFIEQAHLSPVGEKKLFIICDAAQMTPQAQNKILKTLEDAPAHTVFLLLATSIEPILGTVKSRCVTKYCKSLPNSNMPDISAQLKVLGLEMPQKPDYKTLTVLSQINRNISANCSAQNQPDLLLIELVKQKEAK